MSPSLPCEWDEDFWADDRSFPLDAADVESPLKPEELQVLRAQYEKEGEYVGLQTKFNYAWVRLSPALQLTTMRMRLASFLS
jgi:hypothetical protein